MTTSNGLSSSASSKFDLPSSSLSSTSISCEYAIEQKKQYDGMVEMKRTISNK
jgi:hypothetical protein